MTDSQISSSDIHDDFVENLIEFPISTDIYMIYVYFAHYLVRSQFVYSTIYDMIFTPCLFLVLIFFTFPFYFLKKYEYSDFPEEIRRNITNVRFSKNVPDLLAKKTVKGFKINEVHFIKSPDARFMERSSVLGRLIFAPIGAFSKNNPDAENNFAQLSHDIGHSVNYDYILEKAAFFIIIDLIMFYFLHRPKFNFSNAVGVWVELTFALYLFLIFARYSKFLHAREFRADVYGYNIAGDYMVNFLKDGAGIEKFVQHKSGKRKFLAELFHPSFARRLERLTICMPDAANCSHIKGYVKNSLSHSRLLLMAAWGNIYWSMFMSYSYVSEIINPDATPMESHGQSSISKLLIINILILLFSLYTFRSHFFRMQKISKQLTVFEG